MYTVTVDREACDGVFACLVRDERFEEDEDGLATFDPSAAAELERTEATVAATFDDDRRDEAEQAAAACPLDAIAVEDAAGEDVDAGEATPESGAASEVES